MPIETRMVASVMPSRSRTAFGTPEWVVEAGWLASDSVPPKLTASLNSWSALSTRNASASPPATSNEKVEPGAAHCAA